MVSMDEGAFKFNLGEGLLYASCFYERDWIRWRRRPFTPTCCPGKRAPEQHVKAFFYGIKANFHSTTSPEKFRM